LTQKKGNLTTIAIVVVAICLTATTFAALDTTQILSEIGNVKTVNLSVYTDANCTQNCTSLGDFAVISGCNTSKTVYVKNMGNVPQTLNMTVSNWNPSNASSYLTLTWDQENTVLDAGQIVVANFTLTAVSKTDCLTKFGYLITLTGSP
jgi:hypothetical protein